MVTSFRGPLWTPTVTSPTRTSWASCGSPSSASKQSLSSKQMTTLILIFMQFMPSPGNIWTQRWLFISNHSDYNHSFTRTTILVAFCWDRLRVAERWTGAVNGKTEDNLTPLYNTCFCRAVSFEDIPESEPNYPKFCNSIFYIFNPATANRLVQIAKVGQRQNTHILFIQWFLIHKMINIKMKKSWNIRFYRNYWLYINKFFPTANAMKYRNIVWHIKI